MKVDNVPYDTWHSVHRTKAHPGDDKTKKTMTTDYKLRTLSATGLKRLWKRYVACKFDAGNPKCKHLNEDYDNVFDTWLGKQNYTIKKNGNIIEKCDKKGKNCKELDDYEYEEYKKSKVAGGTRRRVKRTKNRRK